VVRVHFEPSVSTSNTSQTEAELDKARLRAPMKIIRGAFLKGRQHHLRQRAQNCTYTSARFAGLSEHWTAGALVASQGRKKDGPKISERFTD
jgi:hypothetical protein